MATIGDGHSRGTSSKAAAVPSMLNAQMLEENPVLPLDNQKNLVYTLTRIFRVLAQIVNPLVAWADKWKYVTPIATTQEPWGIGIDIKADAPTTGNSTAIRMWAEEPNGVNYINGSRSIPGNDKERTYWQIEMPSPAGDFLIQRSDPLADANGTGAVERNALSIVRATGSAIFETDISIRTRPPSPYNPGLYLDKSASGKTCDIAAYTNGLQRWLLRLSSDEAETGSNNGSNCAFHRYDDAGGYLGGVLTLNRRLGTIQMPYQPAFAANCNTSTQPGTLVAWSAGVNIGNCFANSRFTAPIGGMYFFAFQLLTNNIAGDHRVALRFNGSAIVVTILTNQAGFQTINGEVCVYLSPGDYVDVVYISGPGALYPDYQYNYFSGFMRG
jgi:hypothetical protein